MANNLAIYNANVIPMEDQKRYSAVLVENGLISAVGTDEEILTAAKNAGIAPTDAGGATVLPGFFDCHAHLFEGGENYSWRDVYHVRSIAQLMDELRDEEKNLKPGEWLLAKRLDEALLAEKRPPLMSELDGFARPVLIMDRGGHYMVVNRIAFDDLGITEDMNGVRKGADGRPNGRLHDDARTLAPTRLPKDNERRRKGVLAYLQLAASLGITTIHDVVTPGKDDEEMDFVFHVSDGFPLDREIWWCDTDVEKIKARGLKNWGADIVMDGSIGSRTAAFEENFSDGDTPGYLIYSLEDVIHMVERAVENDLCIGFHAIGRLGIKRGLDAFEAVLKAHPEKKDTARFRLDHFGFPLQEDIDRAAKLGVVISTQPAFPFLRGGPDSVYRSRLGETREKAGYPLRRLLDAGLIVGGGSDDPATPLGSMLGIHSAVNPPYPENAITPYEAVRIYTADAAKLSGEFDTKGTITVGKRGDLVMLAEDPLTVNPQTIKDIKVLMTVCAGEISYQAENC